MPPPAAPRARSAGLFAPLVLAWGFNYLFVRVGLGFAAPLWLAAARAAVGALVVGALLLAVPSRRGTLDRAGRRDALLLGLPNTTLFFGLWFIAAGAVLPGEAAVVIYTFPLWVAVFSYPVLGQRLSWLARGAIGLGFLGVLLITEPWSGGSALPPIAAIVELLAGAVSWALGTVYFQKRFRGAEMQEANFYQLLGGATGLAIAGAVTASPLPPPSWPLLATVVWLGAIGTAIAYAIWFDLLGRLPAATLGAYVFLVPVVALAASAVLFGERLDAVQLAGVGAVIVSIYATARRSGPFDEPAG